MPVHRVVVSVSGGLVVDVLTNVPDVEVILVDFDLDAYDEETTAPVEFDCQGEHYKVFVQDLPFEKLPSSSLSFVGAALNAAGRQSVFDRPPTHLSDRELATVLAALRYWQNGLLEDGEELWIATSHFQEHTPLTADEIDDLCDRLNG